MNTYYHKNKFIYTYLQIYIKTTTLIIIVIKSIIIITTIITGSSSSSSISTSVSRSGDIVSNNTGKKSRPQWNTILILTPAGHSL